MASGRQPPSRPGLKRSRSARTPGRVWAISRVAPEQVRSPCAFEGPVTWRTRAAAPHSLSQTTDPSPQHKSRSGRLEPLPTIILRPHRNPMTLVGGCSHRTGPGQEALDVPDEITRLASSPWFFFHGGDSSSNLLHFGAGEEL